MTFKESFNVCMFKKFATFSGRASRSEFWYFMLATLIISIIVSIIEPSRWMYETFKGLFGGDTMLSALVLPHAMSYIVQIVFCIPILSAANRRLHDVNIGGGKATLYYLILTVPFIIWFIYDLRTHEQGELLLSGLILSADLLATFAFVIYLLCMKGNKDENKFGTPPRDDASNFAEQF